MKTIAFFNNKGGVGKTSLVYHLAWIFSELGKNVIAADLDPQANLTSMFLNDDRLEELWPDDGHSNTIFGAIEPILKGTGDIANPHIESIDDNLGLLVGDLWLSMFEEKLSNAWAGSYRGDEADLRKTSAFYRILLKASEQRKADLVLIDIGPNLGAINRSAMIAAQNIVIPLAPDLFSLQGLRNLGATLKIWSSEWQEILKKPTNLPLPSGSMKPAGYVVMQHAIKSNRPTKSYLRWIERIPNHYREFVLNTKEEENVSLANDPYLLSTLKHYRSLMAMAMEARKPIFKLAPGDGALGSHFTLAQECYKDFKELALKIAKSCDITI